MFVSQRTSWLRPQDGALQRGGSRCRSGKKVGSDLCSGVIRADRTKVGWCQRLCYGRSWGWGQVDLRKDTTKNIRLCLKRWSLWRSLWFLLCSSRWRHTSSQVLVMMFFVASIVRTGTCQGENHHHVRQIGAITDSLIMQVFKVSTLPHLPK